MTRLIRQQDDWINSVGGGALSGSIMARAYGGHAYVPSGREGWKIPMELHQNFYAIFSTFCLKCRKPRSNRSTPTPCPKSAQIGQNRLKSLEKRLNIPRESAQHSRNIPEFWNCLNCRKYMPKYSVRPYLLAPSCSLSSAAARIFCMTPPNPATYVAVW